ncbi:MAG: DNA primase [Anaerolineae bacterium]
MPMSVVDEIKERLDLVDVVRRYVQLQKTGHNYKALCPFHNEKTPSFVVFPDSQNWHCFGCDRGGDIFSFVMEYEGWDFRTALEELGRQAGVEVRQRTPAQIEAAKEKDRLLAVLEAATDYYHTLLHSAPEAEKARAYVKQRGFTAETVERFQLGYSLRSWDALRTHLLGQGFTVEELIKAGLLVQREEGGTYDRFRDRLMIPIRDRRGRVIAFGGRVLHPDDVPKYINSPQTPLFDKSKVLFGLDMAARPIREADAAIIVEGYMDVMIPYQEGYENVVAPMGTALTETHLKLLQRLTRNFILALDPDAAGVNATLRGLETAREALDRQWRAVFDPQGLVGYESRLDADIRVVLLPQGVDPDELILEDKQAWEQLLEEAQPVVRFYFQHLLQQEDPEEPKGKARIVDAMLPLLRDISNGVEREAYAQEIAVELGISARTLLDRLRAHERVRRVHRRAAIAAGDRSALPADLEGHALNILLHRPGLETHVDIALIEMGFAPIQDEDFTGDHRYIWETWLEVLANPTLSLEELLLPSQLETVTRWRSTPLPEKELEEWKRDVVRTLLSLREQRLRNKHRQIQQLLFESQVKGLHPDKQYGHVLNQIHENLRRIQRALNPRRVEARRK